MHDNVRPLIDLRSLIESHEHPFMVIDRDFKIIAVNSAYERVYGFTAQQLQGKKCHQAAHGNDRPCFEHGEHCPHQQIFDKGEQNCSFMHLHYEESGAVQRVQVRAYPLQDADGRLYLGETVQNLTASVPEGQQPVRMVGKSPAFLRMQEQLELASMSDATVLLEGETGTGKEIAARIVHQHSSRAHHLLQTIDCTVFSETLFEAEIFGHEKGAFTGSVGEKAGLFEMADGGTLFLDEIGELPLAMQAKLLRVLETGEFRRVGGRKVLHTDARIICATNRQLGRDVDAGKFREDLYYRLACIHIWVPSLRERSEDIAPLAHSLLEDIGTRIGRAVRLDESAMPELEAYCYPGNIRELKNILAAAVAQNRDGLLGKEQITAIIGRRQDCRGKLARAASQPVAGEAAAAQQRSGALRASTGLDRRSTDRDRRSASGRGQRSSSGRVQPPATLEELELARIKELLAANSPSRKHMARQLGISERTLYRKLKQHGLV